MLQVIEVDDKATSKKVTKFFTKELDKYQNFSATKYDLKSVNFSGLKVDSTPNPSSVDNRLILIMTYQARLACVEPAIDKCTNRPDKPLQKILKLRYIDHVAGWQVEQRLGYGHTYFNELRRQATLQFADVFLMEQLSHGVKDVLDLHVYKD